MRSVMDHQFSQLPEVNIQRSTFNRTHGYKTTFNAGYLVPFYVDEVLPGDTFSLDCDLLARLSTPIVPIMDNLYLETFFFYVPYRLVWDNWEKFCGERTNPGDSIDYLTPQVTTPDGGWDYLSLEDYFGLPVKVPGLSVCSFWHRAYSLIWNEWFRDENLQDSVEVPMGDGPDDPSLYKLLRRGKRHDYFTSALPWPQKGDPVHVSVGDTAYVYGTGQPAVMTTPTGAGYLTVGDQGSDDVRYNGPLGSSRTSLAFLGKSATANPALYAELSDVAGPTVNALRQAFQIQRMLETDARSGTRYRELILAHFGVVAPDYRVQVPEFLGGHSSQIFFTPVPQTSDTASDNTTPQGNLAAYAFSNSDRHGFVKSFTEFGLVIGLVNVRADLTYQQGLPRMFSRRTRYDYYWPSLAHLGEQAILNKEIVATGTDTDDQVFGYQERYAEYRYYPSKITGVMRSTHPQSLDVWHLSQKFDGVPPLNADFIQDDPPIERILAVQDEPQFYLDVFCDLKSTRPMPVYSIPGLIDHF